MKAIFSWLAMAQRNWRLCQI